MIVEQFWVAPAEWNGNVPRGTLADSKLEGIRTYYGENGTRRSTWNIFDAGAVETVQ